MVKAVLLGLLALVVVVIGVVVAKIGPRNVVGMILYDQREEGKLQVGDHAPDVVLLAPDGKSAVRLSETLGGRPSVLIFGSFT